MKRPAYQFYPGDEERDAGVRRCSLAAFGLWRRMLNFMHDGDPYGHLAVAGDATTPAQLARLVGESPTVVKKLLAELESAQVFSRTTSGVIYCRRMTRDEHIRTVRSQAGKLGGNPSLVDKQSPPDDADLLKQPDKQTPTPAVALATASASAQPELALSPRVREERDRLLARLPEAFHTDVDVWLARLADDTRRFSSLRRMLATLWPEGGEAKWPKGEHVGLALQGYNAENGDRWPFFESILRGVREQAKYGVATPRPPAPSGTGPSRFTAPEDPDAPLDAPSSANVARRRDADPEWWERMQAEAAAAGRSNPWRYAYKAMQAEAYARPIPTP
jgi:hypothetical protein